ARALARARRRGLRRVGGARPRPRPGGRLPRVPGSRLGDARPAPARGPPSRAPRLAPPAGDAGRVGATDRDGRRLPRRLRTRARPVPMFRPRDRWWLAAVVIAAVVPYLNSLPGAFVFDDFGLATQNPYATPGMPLLAWFTRPSTTGSLYRPLTMVSYGLNAMLSPNPLSYHLM